MQQTLFRVKPSLSWAWPNSAMLVFLFSPNSKYWDINPGFLAAYAAQWMFKSQSDRFTDWQSQRHLAQTKSPQKPDKELGMRDKV